jgi:hypothetical protein
LVWILDGVIGLTGGWKLLEIEFISFIPKSAQMSGSITRKIISQLWVCFMSKPFAMTTGLVF